MSLLELVFQYSLSLGMPCFHFQLFQDLFYFLFEFFLTYWLFRSILFNLHTFVNFPVFFLLLSSSFMLLLLEKIVGTNSIFLHLLRLFL